MLEASFLWQAVCWIETRFHENGFRSRSFRVRRFGLVNRAPALLQNDKQPFTVRTLLCENDGYFSQHACTNYEASGRLPEQLSFDKPATSKINFSHRRSK
jgi:hypothetical protein